MKYMVISDIHGNIDQLNKALDIYKAQKCEKLLILGDLEDYLSDINLNEIINLLNTYKDKIIYVKGNCDINIDGLLFEDNYIEFTNINNKKILLTHGHLYSKNELLNKNCDIILTGHTHIPEIEKINNTIFVNPGSISRSRYGENSLAIIDEEKIYIKDLYNNTLYEYLI